MFISEVLQHKGPHVITTAPSTPVRDLLALLAEHNLGAVVVSTDGETIQGIVSERDVVRRLAGAHPKDTLDGQVEAIMTSTVRTCEPGDTVDSLMRLMTEHRFRHVPVVHDGRLCGLVSIGDVVKTRIGELEFEREQLEHYIGRA